MAGATPTGVAASAILQGGVDESGAGVARVFFAREFPGAEDCRECDCGERHRTGDLHAGAVAANILPAEVAQQNFAAATRQESSENAAATGREANRAGDVEGTLRQRLERLTLRSAVLPHR